MPDRSRSMRRLRIGLVFALVMDSVLVALNYKLGSPVTQFALLAVNVTWAWAAAFIALRARRERGPDA